MAEALGITKQSVMSRVRNGDLLAVKVGNQWVIADADFESFKKRRSAMYYPGDKVRLPAGTETFAVDESDGRSKTAVESLPKAKTFKVKAVHRVGRGYQLEFSSGRRVRASSVERV